MIPYGIKKRDDYFQERELLNIRKPNTCEMLCRPSIGISEFGEAVEMCPPPINTLLDEINLHEVVDHLHEVKDLAEIFNKRGNCREAPEDSDLKRLIRFMIQPNERMEDMLCKTEEMALYLYTTINNIRQMQLLMMNPKEFASISQHEQGKDGDFKRNPTLEGMLAYLRQQIFGSHVRQTDVRTRERLLRELDGSSRKRRSARSSEEETPSKSRRTTSRRSRSASISPEEQYSRQPSTSRTISTRRTRRTTYGREQNWQTKRMAKVLGTSSSEQESDVFLKHSTPRSDRRNDDKSEEESQESLKEKDSTNKKMTAKAKTAKSRAKTSESENSEESSESEETRTEMEKPLSSATSKASTKNDSTKKTAVKQSTKTKKVQPTDTTEKKTEQVVIESSDKELEDNEPLANIQKRLRQEEETNSDAEETDQSSGTKAHTRYLEITDAEQNLFITQIPGPSHATDAEQYPEESDGEHE